MVVYLPFATMNPLVTMALALKLPTEAPSWLTPYNQVAEDFGAAYSVMTPLAVRVKATDCWVLSSVNWPTTVPSSLTPFTMLKEYPVGAEKVSNVQEAVGVACIATECNRSMTIMAWNGRRLIRSSLGLIWCAFPP